jgi:hypothetical protein
MSLLVYIEFPLINYLITNINIAKRLMLSSIIYILDVKRKEFVLGIVNKLKEFLIFNKINKMLFFNLITILGGLFFNKRYDFLTI